jgi:Protein of unknown function (DUF3318)
MVISRPKATHKSELNRLKLLIPPPLQEAIEIEPATQVDRPLITTHRIEDRRCQIQIDVLSWQSLDIDVRNLLFWHEIARIQTGSVSLDRSEYIAVFAGLGIASIDLVTENIGMLAAALVVAGLASFRLYQKYLGEQNLRKLTTADRDAIDLAVEFGYDRQMAREILRSAIQYVMKKSRHRWERDRGAARIQVLSLSQSFEDLNRC